MIIDVSRSLFAYLKTEKKNKITIIMNNHCRSRIYASNDTCDVEVDRDVEGDCDVEVDRDVEVD